MPTLLLRLAAPLQSWGIDSKFETRRTNREPTKSGVTGLLAAALGLRRDDDENINRLNQLSFGVRTDQAGSLLTDFQIAWRYRAGKKDKNPNVTYRYYLADAIFLAGLESDDQTWLKELELALEHPAYPLFLGRRSCPPTPPLCLGIRERDLSTSLKNEPWQGTAKYEPKVGQLQIMIEVDSAEPGAIFQKDLSISFSPIHRQYGYRKVKWINVELPKFLKQYDTKHDTFSELE